MNFKEELNNRINEVEDVLNKYLPQLEGFQKEVIEAMHYSVMAGGKRLRPLLIKEVYSLFGGSDKRVEPFMAAMEMIHTYSLVHDDLPAMDNDEYRRGRKTTHVVYGEAIGILTGDALLNYAFEILTKELLNSKDIHACAKAIHILARKAGINGMIGGQVVDISVVDKSVSLEKLNDIYRLKTSALIEASMMIGAVLAGAGQNEIDLIEELAREIGMAFQIKDDVLDVTSSIEQLGKPVFSDDKNKKTTYVTLMGIERANNEVEKLSSSAIKKLNSFNGCNEFLKELLIKLINREK